MLTKLTSVWLIAALLVDASSSWSQTQLPPCPKFTSSNARNSCFGEVHIGGHKYVGEFRYGAFNGRGSYTMADGQKYVGEFMDSVYHGQGTEYRADGSILRSGTWEYGNFIRADEISTPAAQDYVQELTPLRRESQAATQRQREMDEQPKQPQPQPTVTAQLQAIPALGKRVALVIGNAAYKVHPLRNPRNDADDVSRSLKGSGFEVIDLRDASLTQMRSAIRQFGDKLLASDAGLVYYSGHGIAIRGRNYFIPVNADIQREDEVSDQSLDVALILEKMSTAQKAVNILIVDACRDDPFGRSFRSSSKGLASMEAPRGTIVAYATSPGKVAADGDGRNSPYTKHLVRAMQAPNKPIELVFKEVRRAVQDETKNLQTPWENTSLSGDFYFRVQK